MKLPKLFILSCFALFLFSFENFSNLHLSAVSSDCNLELKYEIKDVAGTEKVDVEIKPEGGKSPYKIIFYSLGDKKKLISTDFDVSKFEGIAKGEYYCIVVDQNECKAEKTIEIK